MDKTLFLLDAYAIIYRGYYALMHAPRFTSRGINTSAIYGFCNTLDELLRKQNPTHMAVCFDPHGPTFRHQAYEQYKANRERQPEDITLAVPYIKRILEAYRIPVIERPGYEADDVVGTLARMAESDGFLTYMVTQDKDYGQLVTDRVLMYRMAQGKTPAQILGPQQICEHFGIQVPGQVIDFLAITGDKVDNVPGCPGIGPKGAQALIARYGNVDNIVANADEIKGKQGASVRGHISELLASRDLVTICTDVPMDGVTPASLAMREPDYDALRQIYGELEFGSLLSRLPKTKKVAAPVETSSATEADNSLGGLFDFDYTVSDEQSDNALDDLSDTVTMFNSLLQSHTTERPLTVGMYVYGTPPSESETRSNPVAIALAYDADNAIALSLPCDGKLNVLLSHPALRLVSMDYKHDLVLLRKAGIVPACAFGDTGVSHYLLESEMKRTPTLLARRYAGRVCPDSYDKPCDNVGIARGLARLAVALDQGLEREYDKLPEDIARNLRKLRDEVELPLIPVLADMEIEGIRVNVDELHRLHDDYNRRLDQMSAQIYSMAGIEFNISSPMQVGDVLFNRLGLPYSGKKTSQGHYSTTEEILVKLSHTYPIVSLILRYRGLRKLLSTYVDALPEIVDTATGKIHTTFNQTVTATGRLSSTAPNLQNIPVRTEDGRDIRRAFVSDPGCLLMSADYSQIELRLMADLSADAEMVKAFMSGEDIHRSTAAKIYHVSVDEVTDDMRRKAKTANFGIIYGISSFGLSERLDIPRSEAKQLIDGYFAAYPHIRLYIDNVVERARAQGFVTTAMGRRRMLPDINSSNATVRAFAARNAVNAPIQGSAADIIKVAMVRIAAEIKKRALRSRMILQVHDELIFNVVPEEQDELRLLVVTMMESAYTGRVPLEVGCGIADNWLDAH